MLKTSNLYTPHLAENDKERFLSHIQYLIKAFMFMLINIDQHKHV